MVETKTKAAKRPPHGWRRRNPPDDVTSRCLMRNGNCVTKNRRQTVRSSKAQSSIRPTDPDSPVQKKSEMSKLRVGFIESDTSPHNIRELLDDIGTVGEVSVHSNQNFTYALADMPYEDAEDAVEFLNNLRWRGNRITVEFANRAYSKRWLSGHDWKPPKRNSW
jgi:RNA recognition motif-containing protein